MVVYNYDKDSHIYLGSDEARIDPLEKSLNDSEVYLIPANSTVIKPPKNPIDTIVVWSGETWVIEVIPNPVVDQPKEITELEMWKQIKESLPSNIVDVRQLLYGFLRYELMENSLQGDLDISRPFHDGLTVDEMTQGYFNYIGDDDKKAMIFLQWKKEAKEYIRSVSIKEGF